MGIFFIVIICFLLTIFSIYYADYRRNSFKIKESFRDNLDIHKVPIITLSNNGKELRFIIDSGASNSMLNTTALKNLDIQIFNTGKISKIRGIGEAVDGAKLAYMELEKDGIIFKENFSVLHIPSLDREKELTGMEVHGLLGNTFLKRYKFIIDYTDFKLKTNG